MRTLLGILAWFGVAMVPAWAGPADLELTPFSYPGCNDRVCALTVHDGFLVAGGFFTQAGGVAVDRIARWDGHEWQPLGLGVAGEREYTDTRGGSIVFPPHVLALAVYDGDLIAAGSFSEAGGQTAHSIARWDGAVWQPLGGGMPAGTSVYSNGGYFHFPPLVAALTVHNGSLIAGGIFRAAGNADANFVARWDGAEWSALDEGFGGGLPARVLALTANSQNQLVAAGAFTSASGVPANGIAFWTGDKWEPYRGTGMNWEINSLILHEDRLVAGGGFTTAGGTEALHIARWGDQAWEPLGDGLPNEVRAMARFHNDLYAGASRWNGSSWINDIQTNGPIYALTVHRGVLVIGGEFSQIGGRHAWNIAAWPDESALPTYLRSFQAWREGQRAMLAWEIDAPLADLVFHVWRQEPGTSMQLVNDIPLTGRQSYTLADPEAEPDATTYWLQQTADDGSTHMIASTLLPAAPALPSRPSLAPNYPNPFNPQTTLTYLLPRTGQVRLAIYDLIGRPLIVLVDGFAAAGEHTASWDGRDRRGAEVASGVYFARLETDTGVLTRKITLAR
jgi:hypothetical protein